MGGSSCIPAATTRGETGPTINIEVDREYRRPVWPSQPDEQTASMHLDIGGDDLDPAVAWRGVAVEAGATVAEQPAAARAGDA